MWTNLILVMTLIIGMGSVAILEKEMDNDVNYFKMEDNVIKDKLNKNIPRNCLDLFNLGVTMNGVYPIHPLVECEGYLVDVYCDMDTDGGGWTVIQRRDNYEMQEDFYRTWIEYADGFGSKMKDFWLGNDDIHILTNQSPTVIRFDIWNRSGRHFYATYQDFKVDNRQNNYRVNFSKYSGNASDSFSIHNGMEFSAKDKDLDNQENVDCANSYKGGWWYNNNYCYTCNPNGVHFPTWTYNMTGITWFHLPGQYNPQETYGKIEMKIRPLK